MSRYVLLRSQKLWVALLLTVVTVACTVKEVPFVDLTNGTETYPGGRYLELDRTPTGIYDLDFNRAFHPFCYYNPKYDCPYPPRENRLQIPIRAGERMSAAKH